MTDIRRYDVLDSTNEEANRLALGGARGPLWVVAVSQSAGRGRRGRAWASVPGNLFASHLIELDAPQEKCAQLSFVAALGIGDLMKGFAPDAKVTLKWPNDILLERRKVAGILLEAAPARDGIRMIIGIGINLSGYPKKTAFPATSIAEVLGEAPKIEDALMRLVAAWDTWYEVWRKEGFGPIRAAWLARAAGIGESLTVRLGDSEMQGVFEDIDDRGALRLTLDDGGVKTITAGDVFFQS